MRFRISRRRRESLLSLPYPISCSRCQSKGGIGPLVMEGQAYFSR